MNISGWIVFFLVFWSLLVVCVIYPMVMKILLPPIIKREVIATLNDKETASNLLQPGHEALVERFGEKIKGIDLNEGIEKRVARSFSEYLSKNPVFPKEDMDKLVSEIGGRLSHTLNGWWGGINRGVNQSIEKTEKELGEKFNPMKTLDMFGDDPFTKKYLDKHPWIPMFYKFLLTRSHAQISPGNTPASPPSPGVMGDF